MPTSITTTELAVSGMRCEGCVNRVSNVLERIEGVRRAEVHLETESAEVEYDPDTTGLEAMTEAIEMVGYSCDYEPAG